MLDYRSKTLWGFRETRIAASFEYEWHDEQGQWYRPYGNELWGFAESGLMRKPYRIRPNALIFWGQNDIFFTRSLGLGSVLDVEPRVADDFGQNQHQGCN